MTQAGVRFVCFCIKIKPPLPDFTDFIIKHFRVSKVYTDEGGIKYFYQCLSTCMGDNLLAKKLVDYSAYRQTNHGINITDSRPYYFSYTCFAVSTD